MIWRCWCEMWSGLPAPWFLIRTNLTVRLANWPILRGLMLWDGGIRLNCARASQGHTGGLLNGRIKATRTVITSNNQTSSSGIGTHQCRDSVFLPLLIDSILLFQVPA